jgi:hypothetical protein
MLRPSGASWNDLDIGADRGQHGRRNLAIRSVRAIDDHTQPFQVATLQRLDDGAAVTDEWSRQSMISTAVGATGT